MASSDIALSKIKEGLKSCLGGSGATTDSLKLTALVKCFNACGLGQYTKTLEAQSFPALQGKEKSMSLDKCAGQLLSDVASRFIGNKYNIKGGAPEDHPEVQSTLNEIKTKLAAQAGKAMLKTAAVDATTARLTDASKYTGSHKERFDADGKGKGLEGRVDMDKNTGYVGNYKGEGMFGKK